MISIIFWGIHLVLFDSIFKQEHKKLFWYVSSCFHNVAVQFTASEFDFFNIAHCAIESFLETGMILKLDVEKLISFIDHLNWQIFLFFRNCIHRNSYPIKLEAGKIRGV